MKLFNITLGQNFKSRTLGLALAAALIPGFAMAGDIHHGRPGAASGQVEVVRQVPGGTVSVGVQSGRPRPVAFEKRREVVRMERNTPRPREVTVVPQEPRREFAAVKTVGHGRGRKEFVEVKREEARGPAWDRHEGRHEEVRRDRNGRLISLQNDRNGQQRDVYFQK